MKLLVSFLCAASLSLSSMAAPARFKQTVAAGYPTFYGVARYDGLSPAGIDHVPAAGDVAAVVARGLAMHVSRSLALTRAQLPAARAQLARVLDDGNDALYGPLFSTDKDATGLTPRRGYYPGYLVARELGKTPDIHALAAPGCDDAHRLVVETVQALQRASVAVMP